MELICCSEEFCININPSGTIASREWSLIRSLVANVFAEQSWVADIDVKDVSNLIVIFISSQFVDFDDFQSVIEEARIKAESLNMKLVFNVKQVLFKKYSHFDRKASPTAVIQEIQRAFYAQIEEVNSKSDSLNIMKEELAEFEKCIENSKSRLREFAEYLNREDSDGVDWLEIANEKCTIIHRR